jgi:hypothetical protein
MIYLGNASSPAIRQAMLDGHFGMLTTPREGRNPASFPIWAADNGCYGKGYPGDVGYLNWLVRHKPHADRCLWATAPDVVGDAAATLKRSKPLMPIIRAIGYRVAFIAQNGIDLRRVPWEDFDALFIGGAAECRPCRYIRPPGMAKIIKRCPICSGRFSEWKLGPEAAAAAVEARARGKAVHMGRVNSAKRILYAASLGCATADGTFLTFGQDTNIERAYVWLDHLNGNARTVLMKSLRDVVMRLE